MFANYKIKKITLIFFLMVLSGCVEDKQRDVWRVLVGVLSDQINLQNISETSVFYVIKQTHEPLLRKKDGENYESKILKNWVRDIDSTRFTFCPNTSKSFDNNHFFDIKFFRKYIVETTQKYGANFTLDISKDCFTINFQTSQKGYLKFLSKYENAPTIKIRNNESGLGPFEITSISNNAITLSRKKDIQNGYNKIILHEYKESDGLLSDKLYISDFNKLPISWQPTWLEEKYIAFDNIELRVSELAINVRDKKIRNAIYNCIDVREFRKAFFPEKKQFLDIKNILPLGVEGGESGVVVQYCDMQDRKLLKGKKVILANQYYNNHKQLARFSKNLFQKTGLKLIIKNYKPKDLLNEIYNLHSRKSYDLIVVFSDTVSDDYQGFFQNFFGDYSVIDYVSLNLKEKYNEFIKNNDTDKKKKLAILLTDEIRKNRIVLPLSQTTVRLFYPPKVKNIKVGRGFLEYPEVAEFRI